MVLLMSACSLRKTSLSPVLHSSHSTAIFKDELGRRLDQIAERCRFGRRCGDAEKLVKTVQVGHGASERSVSSPFLQCASTSDLGSLASAFAFVLAPTSAFGSMTTVSKLTACCGCVHYVCSVLLWWERLYGGRKNTAAVMRSDHKSRSESSVECDLTKLLQVHTVTCGCPLPFSACSVLYIVFSAQKKMVAIL